MNRSIFGVLAAAALLAACAGSQLPIAAPHVAAPAASALHQRTFNYTGAQQTFKVPKGVRAITVDAYGGGTTTGGLRDKIRILGGRTQATLPVTPRETLYVVVGGDGTTGFNGGAPSGCPGTGFGTGAGASDVREHGNGLSNRILVAGGGAGSAGRRGGAGGGLVGQTGGGGAGKGGFGGGGGTQSQGGAGGAGGTWESQHGNPGNPGAFGVGGSGGAPDASSNQECGAGGGGGYYGGGGGGASGGGDQGGGIGGSGGGGSSFTEPSATNVTLTQGYAAATGNGLIVFSW